MPGLTKCNIVETVSILNFLYSTTSLSFFKFRIRRKPPSDFSWTNMGEINSFVSCFVSAITDLRNKVLISAATNSYSLLLKGHWYNLTAGRLSVISICISDTVVRISGSDVSSFHCFRWNLRVLPWNDLTLSWRHFLTQSKIFTCNKFWKEISVSLVSSWSFGSRCLSLYCCAADCNCCICFCSSEIGLTFLQSALDAVSSSGSWKRLWSLTNVMERSASFSPVALALFSAVLSFDFPFLRIPGNQ